MRNNTLRKLLLVCLSTILFTFTATAKVVTPETAASLARKFMTAKGMPVTDVQRFQPAGMTGRHAATTEAPAYHIFHAAGQKGLVIVAGDDIARPILGYTFNADEDIDDIPPAMQWWLEEMERQILQARQAGVQQSAEIARQWRAPSSTGTVIVQLSTALWGQGSPFNGSCPQVDGENCLTGCVATSYAIVMKYYGYPEKGFGTTQAYTGEKGGVNVPSRNLEHPYDWDNMLPEYVKGTYTEAQAASVAQLMGDIGAAIQADYGTEGTSASSGKPTLFSHFRYNPGVRKPKSDYSQSEWYSMLKNELDKAHPIMYRGEGEEDATGHAFVLDGYTDQDYFCVNWGWKGSKNGAYALDALEPGDYKFNSKQFALFDFLPADKFPAVAEVNGLGCPSLSAALSMVTSDGQPTTIKLLQDFTMGGFNVAEKQHVVLDLNGVTVNTTSNIYNKGTLHIKDSGNKGSIVMPRNNSVISNYGTMTIDGGTFACTYTVSEEKDFRRCIWMNENSVNHIKGGTFTSYSTVFVSRGQLTIDGGEFTSYDNASVISHYGPTLTINNGTFTNTYTEKEDTDYRRCIWTDQETELTINNGTFLSSNQTLCIRGTAHINGGTIDSREKSISCLSTGNVTITGGQFYSPYYTLHANTGATLKCYGGLYSMKVNTSYLGDNCECIANSDPATVVKYPYQVKNNSTAIDVITTDIPADATHYDLNGRPVSADKPGLHIIRTGNGQSLKVIRK